MHTFRPVAPVLVAGIALLGGCAPLEWYKSDATADARRLDIDECTTQARMAALHIPAMPPSAPQIIIDSQGRAVTLHPPHRDDERLLAEHDLMRACMRERGYVLQNRAAAAP